MLGTDRVLAIVTARAGSRGIPRKNVTPVAGKPLIAWTIDEARRSELVDHLVVSSDGDEILAVSADHGAATLKRPPELARDETPGIDPVLHALDVLGEGYGIVVLLQPTSPLRVAADVDEVISALERAPAAVSVCVPEHNPWWMYRTSEAGLLSPLMEGPSAPRRQDLPRVVALNGAVYAARIPWLRRTETFVTPETVGVVMPRERSIDIDEPIDLVVAEALLRAR